MKAKFPFPKRNTSFVPAFVFLSIVSGLNACDDAFRAIRALPHAIRGAKGIHSYLDEKSKEKALRELELKGIKESDYELLLKKHQELYGPNHVLHNGTLYQLEETYPKRNEPGYWTPALTPP